MNKKVTIQEAIKANEHSRVRIDGLVWFEVGEIYKHESGFNFADILAEWEIEEKPLELWVNVCGNSYAVYLNKEEADLYAGLNRIRCVKMREVVD